MKPTDRIAELVDAATAGLKDDAELRLDVRAELLSHIEDKAESLRAEGRSKEESLELAVKSFGPATEVAGALVEANRRRMKMRALARLTMRAVLVPAGVAIAFLVCGSLILRVRKSVEAGDAQFEYGTYVPPGIPDESVFLFTGDLSRASKAERQRAIWEQHPESKVYCGNYMTHLVGKFSQRFLLGEAEPTDAELAHFEEEVRRGEALDPDNARHNYLLAGALIVKGSEEEYERKQREDGEWVSEESLVAKDRRLLERAMAEVLEGASKPYLKTHTREMAKERLSLLPPARRYEDKIARMSVAAPAFAFTTDASFHRRAARTIPWLAHLLMSEGRPGDARRLLDTWYPFVRQAVEEASLIDLLTAQAILGVVETEYASAYEKLGDHEEAERTRRWARRLAEPVKRWSEERKRALDLDLRSDKPSREIEESGSSWAVILFPFPKEEHLAPGRYTEHVLIETIALFWMLALLVLWMLAAFVKVLRWRWARGASAAPLLLPPSWKEAARILGFGVLLPLGTFYVYTRWSGLAGREYAVNYLAGRFVLELCLLLATITFLTVSMATECVRERCRTLGIPAPGKAGQRRRTVNWIVLGVLWTTCLALRRRDLAAVTALIVGGLGSIGLLCYVAIMMKRSLSAAKEHGLFHGTLARSFIPVYAAAAILIGGVAHPYLTNLESALVRRDPVLTLDEELLANKPEADLVRRLKAEIREAVDEIEAEKRGR